MTLKKLLKRITILLVVSIVLNLYLISRLGQVEQQLTQRINSAVTYAGRTSDNISSLYHQLRQLKEEQEWLAQADFSLENVSAEGALLTGTFDFRSITPGTQVVLQVRPVKDDWQTEKPTEQNDWQESPAVPQTELTYQAQLQISPDENYEYRLVSWSQDAISASSIKQVPPELYRRPSLVAQMSWGAEGTDGNRKLTSATIELVYQYKPPQFPDFKPVKATLKIMQENGAVTTHEFTPGPYQRKLPFVLEDITDLPPNAQLMATVRYADGYVMNVNVGGTDHNGIPRL